jgi:hypothetical protein
VFSQDESRFGLLTVRRRRLTACSIQPVGPVQHVFEWFYVYGVEEDSRQYLRRLVHPHNAALRHALRPLRRQPPPVMLAVRWEPVRGCWTSAIVPPFRPRFPLGQLVVTPGALAALAESEQSPMEFVRWHHQGDWGEVPEEDRQENEYAVTHGFRLVSAYTLRTGVRIWIITEADRSATTILLPSEY